MDAAVETLLAKQACAELVYRMARGIDRRDGDILRSVFHAGATDDHGLWKGTAADFVPWVLGVLGTMNRTQHFIGNILIEVDGDRAVGESAFQAYHNLPADGGTRDMFACGRYLDRFERRDGRWGVVHRQAIYDWNASAPSTDSWDRAAPGTWLFGRPDAEDGSYAHFAGLAATG